MNIGEAAALARHWKGLSQRAAAKELGMSHVHLSNIENGKVSPTVTTLDRYWDAWRIDVYLLAASKERRVNPLHFMSGRIGVFGEHMEIDFDKINGYAEDIGDDLQNAREASEDGDPDACREYLESIISTCDDLKRLCQEKIEQIPE